MRRTRRDGTPVVQQNSREVVLRAALALMARGERPTRFSVAAEANVPDGTASHWLSLLRKEGVLPPAPDHRDRQPAVRKANEPVPTPAEVEAAKAEVQASWHASDYFSASDPDDPSTWDAKEACRAYVREWKRARRAS